MPRCEICNKYFKDNTQQFCKNCRRYLRNDGILFGKDYSIGNQKVLKNRKSVCKLCGKAFYNLTNHIRQAHDITIDEYIEEFCLPNDIKTAFANRSTYKNTMTEEGKDILRINMAKARQARKIKWDEMREKTGKVTIKRSPKKNLSEKDRERRRLAMILINQNRKNKKNS